MVRATNPFVEEKKRNMELLVDVFKQHKNLTKDKILSMFIIRSGLSRKTIQEYYETLIEAGIIEKDSIRLSGEKDDK